MTSPLPTVQGAGWTVAHFHDSLLSLLKSEKSTRELRLYFYAVTSQGWQLIRSAARRWKAHREDRSIVAYIGTDHGVTDPDALQAMQADGVRVKLLMHYDGVFHPKLVWFVA